MSISVMLVDDQEVIREALCGLISSDSEIDVVAEAGNGLEAIETALKAKPDVILMDLQMNGMNGLQASRVLTRILPSKVILLTVHYDQNLLREAADAGISAYLHKTLSRRELLDAIRRAVAEPSEPARVSLGAEAKRKEMEGILGASVAGAAKSRAGEEPLDRALLNTVVTMVASVEAKDVYTYGHSHKVAQLAEGMARHLRLDADELAEVQLAALAHDVGKIAVPDNVLQSNKALTESEWRYMRQHSAAGADILAAAGLPAAVCRAVRSHHERIDGRGYPDGLRGSSIPFMARLIAVADTFDAITSRRAYRLPRAGDEALEEMKNVAGEQLDEELVDVLFRRQTPGKRIPVGRGRPAQAR